MSFMEMAAEAIQQAMSGELPTSRVNVKECGTATFFALLSLWMHKGAQGGAELAQEVDHLLAALRNKSDPMLSDMDGAELMAMRQSLTMLTKQREVLHARSAKAEARAAPVV